jgi:hypothetical protein
MQSILFRSAEHVIHEGDPDIATACRAIRGKGLTCGELGESARGHEERHL